jgi:hypothetical protein
LPETTSYDKNYRIKMGMGTVNKYNNMQTNNSTLRKSEVVVETYSYTKEDYKEMWLAFTIQRGFWATGILENTLNTIFKKSNIGYGDFVKKFYREFLRSDSCGPVLAEYIQNIDNRFKDYYDPDSEVSNTSLQFPHGLVPLYSTLVLTFFYKFEDCKDYINAWLLKEFPYLSESKVSKELDKVITISNMYTRKRKNIRLISYSNTAFDQLKENNKETGDIISFIMTQMETYTNIKFLVGRSYGI